MMAWRLLHTHVQGMHSLTTKTDRLTIRDRVIFESIIQYLKQSSNIAISNIIPFFAERKAPSKKVFSNIFNVSKFQFLRKTFTKFFVELFWGIFLYLNFSLYFERKKMYRQLWKEAIMRRELKNNVKNENSYVLTRVKAFK